VRFEVNGHVWELLIIDMGTKHWVQCQNGCGTEAWIGEGTDGEPILFDWVNMDLGAGGSFGDTQHLPECGKMRMQKALK